MDIKTILQSIQNVVRPQENLQDEVVIKFLQVLENLHTEELSCEEIYIRLDEFVETELQSKDADKITPLIREHLNTCEDCCEEYEALLTVLHNTKEQ